MSLLEIQVISLTIYKLASLFVGTLLSYFGYKLFMAGVWGNAGEVEGTFKDNKIIIKKAAPGTFFVLAGVIVIGFTIYQGLNYETSESNGSLKSKPVIVD